MKECAYGKEPLDLKLLLLRLIKKLPVMVLAVLLGALCFGGIYFINRTFFGEGISYETVSTYYVDYGTAPLTGNGFTYINGATWNDVWIHSDAFTGQILDKVQPEASKILGRDMEAQEIRDAVSASLETDLRVPIITVKTGNPDLTMLLTEALEETMVAFGEDAGELGIEGIQVIIHPEEASVSLVDNRIVRVSLFGAALVCFLTFVGITLGCLLDDSIYVPETFEYRYGIPMLGYLGGDEKSGEELRDNFSHLFRDAEKIALVSTNQAASTEETEKELEKRLDFHFAEEQNGKDVLLLIEAGARNGKEIEHALSRLRKQDKKVVAALLYHADERLLKTYYSRAMTWRRT